MKSTITFLLRLGFTLVFFMIVQLLKSQDAFSIDSISARMVKQTEIFPQEKLYVHNDKPLYISGEKVWLRAHLVDAYSHRSDSTSIYVYGELINPLDSIVDRIKIRRSNDLYAGQFSLKEDYPAGTYSMRFYTKFMESLGDEYFFKKNIEIGGPFSSKYKTDVSCTYSNNNKTLEVSLEFIDQKLEEKISPTNIAVAYHKNQFYGLVKDGLKKLKIDKEQKVTFKLNIDKEPIKSIYIEYEYDGDFHSEFVTIPAARDDFHVDFFPEGGSLLSGVQMKIAFKALYSDGLSSTVKGVVYSESGDSITSFDTVHLGMGVFPFLAESGEKYYAACTTEDGMTKRFDLPVAESSRYGIALRSTPEFIQIAVLSGENVFDNDRITLLIHSKGRVLYTNEWDKRNEVLQIPRSILPTGIMHCLIVNDQYEPISERLFFNYTADYTPIISLENNKTKYLKRDKVISKLSFADSSGQPLTGNFSVSVTDNKDIKVDDTESILTNLLLTSELKGYIENPSFYFKKGRLAAYTLDILMQTQGWRRYDIPNVLKGNLEHPKGLLEFCQVIRGDVKSGLLLNNKAKNIPVHLLSANMLDKPFVLSTESDEDGRFIFRTDMPDSLSLLIRATTKKGGNRVLLELENDKYPALGYALPRHLLPKKQLNSYFDKADLKYTTESGMRLINLKDVEVVGKDLRKEARRSRYSSPINTVYDSEKFERLGARSLKDLLTRIGGVRIQGDEAFIRANSGAATVLVDDIEFPELIAWDPHIDEIESVEVVKDGMAAIFGGKGTNGVILITTKRGDASIADRKPLNMTKISPLGYQTTAQFYSPKYETAAQKNDLLPDLRTTLYWNPYVKVEDGKAEVSFYTADEASEYTLLLEGVTNEGKPMHLLETIGVAK